MPNLTISLKEELLKKSRNFAAKTGNSLNSLIRNLLTKEIEDRSDNWLTECFKLMDDAGGNSNGITIKREELYDR